MTRTGDAARSGAYVLVADADSRRMAACLDAIRPHHVGLLVARHRDEALGALREFGAPLLLVVDLSLPPQDAFGLIDAACRTGCLRILAWSSSRELRELALCRLAGRHTHVLAGTVGPSIIRSTIDQLLGHGSRTAEALIRTTPAPADAGRDDLTELAVQVRRLGIGAGVAVYLRESPEDPFRSSVTWPRDEPIPELLDYLPATLERIVETRAPVAGPGIAAGQLPSTLATGSERPSDFVAVPVLGRDEHEVIGMICVFDDKPLAIGDKEVEALRELGRRGTTDRRVPLAALRQIGRDRMPAGPAPAAWALQPGGHDAAVLNRQAGSVAVRREMARARREQNPLSALLLGVDETGGEVNDATVAYTIDLFGGMLTRVIRAYDLAIRWSSQELLVVLPGVDESGAGRVADRVSEAVRAGGAHRFPLVGVASLENDSTPESLVMRATRNRRRAGGSEPPGAVVG